MRILFRQNLFDKTEQDFDDHSNQFERPVKLPISDHSHIKDHVNMM